MQVKGVSTRPCTVAGVDVSFVEGVAEYPGCLKARSMAMNRTPLTAAYKALEELIYALFRRRNQRFSALRFLCTRNYNWLSFLDNSSGILD